MLLGTRVPCDRQDLPNNTSITILTSSTGCILDSTSDKVNGVYVQPEERKVDAYLDLTICEFNWARNKINWMCKLLVPWKLVNGTVKAHLMQFVNVVRVDRGNGALYAWQSNIRENEEVLWVCNSNSYCKELHCGSSEIKVTNMLVINIFS